MLTLNVALTLTHTLDKYLMLTHTLDKVHEQKKWEEEARAVTY